MGLFRKKVEMPRPEDALPGRDVEMPVPDAHYVLGTPLQPPYEAGHALALFGLGCFWGAERKFWEAGDGILSTSVGYAA